MSEDVCKCAVIYSLYQNRLKTSEILCLFDLKSCLCTSIAHCYLRNDSIVYRCYRDL